MLLRLLEELLASRAGGNRSRLPELLPWLLELLGLEGWLLELLGLLESGLLGRQSRLEVGGQRVDLSILVLVPGETLQSNVFPGQLGNWHQGSTGLLRSKLLLLLGSKLLLRGKLLPLLRSELLLGSKLLLLLRGKLLLLGSKLLLLPPVLEILELSLKGRPLWLLGSKLLLRGKLLLLLRSKLLLLLGSKLLLLLELPEVLVEVLVVELLGSRLVGVELGSVEDRALGSSLLATLGSKLPPLLGVVSLAGDGILPLDNTGLVSQHSLVPLPLQVKLRAGGDRDRGSISNGSGSDPRVSVRGESSAVVGRVLHNHDLTLLVQVSILALNVAFLVSCLKLEGSVGCLVTNRVCAVIVDLVDLLEDDGGVLGGGGRGGLGLGGGGGGGHLGGGDRLLAALGRLLRERQAGAEGETCLKFSQSKILKNCRCLAVEVKILIVLLLSFQYLHLQD